jgi:alkanesulfonate monooxygenase SsuD/methylene tetrahydromethanopterin reductase-like flavin-dependent oxidoreductase (luciferase family)
VPIELAPVQLPHPPIWYATSGLERIPWLASRGFNMVVQGPAERVRTRLERYRELWSGRGPQPKLGVLRTVVVADSDTAAVELARAPFREHYTSLVKLWREHNMPTAAESFTPDLEEEMRDDKAYVGSPSTVRDQLAEFFARTGCEYLIIRPMFGNLPFDRALASLELFVHEVMPAFAPSPAAVPS